MATEQSLLPIIESCEGCGACCMEQTSPPGYALILSQPDTDFSDGPFAEDADRLAKMPNNVRGTLVRYLRRLQAGEFDGKGERPCIWLDPVSRQCMHYEWRPDICRDFERGSEGCHEWRNSEREIRDELPGQISPIPM